MGTYWLRKFTYSESKTHSRWWELYQFSVVIRWNTRLAESLSIGHGSRQVQVTLKIPFSKLWLCKETLVLEAKFAFAKFVFRVAERVNVAVTKMLPKGVLLPHFSFLWHVHFCVTSLFWFPMLANIAHSDTMNELRIHFIKNAAHHQKASLEDHFTRDRLIHTETVTKQPLFCFSLGPTYHRCLHPQKRYGVAI